MKASILAAGLATVATMATAEVPVLTVLTYDSFTAEWGPGPAVEKAFEETCACDLQFVAAGDGAALRALGMVPAYRGSDDAKQVSKNLESLAVAAR